jgi:hypothetical protein
MQNAPSIFGDPQRDPDPAQSEPISYNHHDAVRCMRRPDVYIRIIACVSRRLSEPVRGIWDRGICNMFAMI